MYIIGLNLTETRQGLSLMDGAAALICEAGILGAIAEERLTRKKHSGGVRCSVDYLLGANRLAFEDIDCFAVSICCDVPPDLDHAQRVLASQGVYIPTDKLFICRSHHLAHAASAYLTSPFDEALIFVTDNEGNTLDPVQPNYQANSNERTSYYLAQGDHIRLVSRDATGPGDWGLGNVYGAATQWFGYPSYQHAGEFMGAAAYGDPERFKDISFFRRNSAGEITALVEPNTDKSLAIRRTIFNQTAASGQGIDVGWNAPESVQSPSQTQFDIAFLAQSELEKAAMWRIAALVKETGVRNLVVSGGVGLNCIMNKRLLESAGIEALHVLPAPGDDGQGLGNALLALREDYQIDRDRFYLRQPYLGRTYCTSEITSALERAANRLEYWRLPLPQLLSQTAQQIADGAIICWFQGGSEFGPRALGNRSILADPRRSDMRDVLNKRVKHREPFRPLCPSVLADRALDYFETDFSPFMNIASSVRPSRQHEIPTVVHRDGTARLQTVEEEINPRFYGLLREFDKLTGVPVLLNTSFNRREPIVESPDDAIRTFLEIDVDQLILGDYVVTKRGGRPQ